MQDKTNSQVKPGYWLAASGTLFAVLVIVLGAFTRLVDAGLGCPDWPGCYGHILWPMDEAEVAAANAAFPEAPVEHDKTWPEQVHRLLATSLGLFCIAFVVMAYRQRLKGFNAPIKLTLLLLAMVILQGMFGRWTVTLNLWPQSPPNSSSARLSAWRSSRSPGARDIPRRAALATADHSLMAM